MILWSKEVLLIAATFTWLLRYAILRGQMDLRSISLDSRDFNNFADAVKELIEGYCSIIYTDFASHVDPFVLALRDKGVLSIGYYGKMKESENRESYCKWKSEEIQIIVAMRAFGLGINKSNFVLSYTMVCPHI